MSNVYDVRRHARFEQPALFLQDSGTTATVVLICGSQIVTANVGDSLAYMDVGSSVQHLTANHRIDDNVAEQTRIIDSGKLTCMLQLCLHLHIHVSVCPLHTSCGDACAFRCLMTCARLLACAGGELGQAAIDGKPVGPQRVWPGGLAFSRYLPASCPQNLDPMYDAGLSMQASNTVCL